MSSSCSASILEKRVKPRVSLSVKRSSKLAIRSVFSSISRCIRSIRSNVRLNSFSRMPSCNSKSLKDCKASFVAGSSSCRWSCIFSCSKSCSWSFRLEMSCSNSLVYFSCSATSSSNSTFCSSNRSLSSRSFRAKDCPCLSVIFSSCSCIARRRLSASLLAVDLNSTTWLSRFFSFASKEECKSESFSRYSSWMASMRASRFEILSDCSFMTFWLSSLSLTRTSIFPCRTAFSFSLVSFFSLSVSTVSSSSAIFPAYSSAFVFADATSFSRTDILPLSSSCFSSPLSSSDCISTMSFSPSLYFSLSLEYLSSIFFVLSLERDNSSLRVEICTSYAWSFVSLVSTRVLPTSATSSLSLLISLSFWAFSFWSAERSCLVSVNWSSSRASFSWNKSRSPRNSSRSCAFCSLNSTVRFSTSFRALSLSAFKVLACCCDARNPPWASANWPSNACLAPLNSANCPSITWRAFLCSASCPSYWAANCRRTSW